MCFLVQIIKEDEPLGRFVVECMLSDCDSFSIDGCNTVDVAMPATH